MTELIPIGTDLFSVTGDVSPGPGFRVDTRMTGIRLPDDGGLLLVSPTDLDDATAASIDALGAVRHLVAPNLFHHFFLGKAKERWTEAQVWGPAGLKEKTGFEPDRELEPGELWPGIEVFAIEGMPKFREHVLFHRASGTLIATDLVFHKPHGHNLATRLFFRVFGTYGRFAVSRLFKSMIKDKAAFSASCRRLFELPIERVVMAHGDVLEADAATTFRATLEAQLSS